MARVFSTVRRLMHEVVDDDLAGEAAKVAFFLFLSVVPLAITLLSLTGLVGGDAAFQWAMARVSSTVPPETANYLAHFIAEITNQPRPGVFSVSALFTLWSASGGIAAIGEGLNKMYDLDETRPFWKRRLASLGLVVLLCAVLIAGAMAIVAGPAIARAVHLNLGPVGTVIGYALSFAVAVTHFYALYYLLPNKDQKRCKPRVLAGAVFGAIVWLLGTAGFRFYAAHFGSFGKTYGALAGVVVMMLWFYVTSGAILIGGELAAVLEERAAERQRAGTERDTRDDAREYRGSLRHA